MGRNTVIIKDDKAAYNKIMQMVSQLSQADKDEAIQAGLKKGGNLIKKAAKSELKARNGKVTGNLERSFAVQSFRKKKKVHVGFKRKKKYKGSEVGGGNHAHLVDKGTKLRYTKRPYTVVYKSGRVQHFKAGLSRGAMYAGKSNTKWGGKYYHPHGQSGFYTTAKNNTAQTAMTAVMNGINKAIKKIMSRNK